MSGAAVLYYGKNPAPHVVIHNAFAFGGVTFPWYRARDGGKHSVASLVAGSGGEVQEEFSQMEF